MKTDSTEESENLRLKAEEVLKKDASVEGNKTELPSSFSEFEMKHIIHDLEVPQIELKLQNEELQLAKEQAENAAQQYTELYDFAPSGHFTLSTTGEILEVNLFGSKMLGKERSRIINSQFGFIVSDDTKPDFNFFLERIFTSKVKESCELTLSITGNLPIVVQLAGIINKNGEQCLSRKSDQLCQCSHNSVGSAIPHHTF